MSQFGRLGGQRTVSGRFAGSAAVTAMLAVVRSPRWLAAYPIVATVCWARVAPRHHTPDRTAAGAALGASTVVVFLSV